MATWPRRRGSRRNSGELACVAVAYQALPVDTGGGSRLLGWRWSAAVVMEWLGASLSKVMATVELWELGGCCWRCETMKETEAKQMGCSAECGRALGRLRHALAWLCHAG